MKMDNVAIAINPIFLVFLISVFLFTLLFVTSLEERNTKPIPTVIRECPDVQDSHLRETIKIIFSEDN